EAAEARKDLGAAVALDVVGETDARSPVVVPLEAAGDGGPGAVAGAGDGVTLVTDVGGRRASLELLLLVTNSRPPRHLLARRPGVLDEEARVLLRGLAARVQVRARHAVDLPVDGVGKDADVGAGRGLGAVGSLEGRPRALVDVRVRDVLVLHAVTHLVVA